jgi:hypothetical protein
VEEVEIEAAGVLLAEEAELHLRLLALRSQVVRLWLQSRRVTAEFENVMERLQALVERVES